MDAEVIATLTLRWDFMPVLWCLGLSSDVLVSLEMPFKRVQTLPFMFEPDLKKVSDIEEEQGAHNLIFPLPDNHLLSLTYMPEQRCTSKSFLTLGIWVW